MNALVLREEGEPSVRPRRRPNAIVTSWDDRVRSDMTNFSWKNFRRTQYRVSNSLRTEDDAPFVPG